MSVVGLDLGNEKCIIGVARQRGIDVVLNDEGRRETPAMVSFSDKQRYIGTAAASTATMNPKNSVSQIKRLIGRRFRDPEKRKSLGTTVLDCVVGIPVHFSELQRRAYLDAAAIAGLRPLRLMHETTATALAYGIYKPDLPDDEPFNVVFVDIGHANEEILSASTEARLNIEWLMDDKDVNGHMKREFDCLTADLLERVKFLFEKALVESGLPLEKIGAVEVVGSGSRIPAILRILASVFRKEPSRTLNASECIARGCALQCAMMIPTFKVRHFEVRDSFPVSIGLTWKEVPFEARNIVFGKGSSLRSAKVLTFQRSGTLLINVFYADASNLPPGAALKVGTYQIGPLKTNKFEKANLKLKIRLDIHGTQFVEPASKAVEKEREMALQDRMIEEMKEKNNAVEAYVYDMKNKLSDTLEDFTSERESEELGSLLQQTELWLYEEGEDETENVYITKLAELKKVRIG
ncbi:hypothetical protein R1flu_001310 [Riccia fluitans]|uniref:Heat shock protein 70 n=1 Tax=Riccia fluitans TaxID=41844 RepID=A0ABD1Y2X1_9MARC